MKLFKCAECNQWFPLVDFTDYKVCCVCYDRYWEEYCRYMEEQYEDECQNKYEEYQVEEEGVR